MVEEGAAGIIEEVVEQDASERSEYFRNADAVAGGASKDKHPEKRLRAAF